MKKCPKCEQTYQDNITLCPSDGTVLAKADDSIVGQTLAEKYRIDEFLSHGGMGTVYRGTHILMDKIVAIKVLHPSLAADDKIVARFSREARAASRISHPHALNVTDFGESQNGIVFLVMEYLHGKTLKQVIHEEGPMPLPRIVEIIRQVCGALDAAHAEGVVHRDLKSDNIMLIDVGGGDWAKVLDFGIAKIQEPVGSAKDSALTSPNLIIGTPQYMSPEQCSQASELDARSDIYSLGVILYELLVGHVPFIGESPTAVMMKHLQEPAPSVLDERKDVPAAVGRVVARAMAKRPEDRYQSAGELAEALNSASEEAAPTVAAGSTTTAQDERSTNRIIVPTDSNEMVRTTASEERDEATVVRPREREEIIESEARVFQESPPPVEAFKPWRIIIPAAVGLLVVFGVIWALTRNSGQPTTNQQAAPLVVDPNSQNVQPMQSPTGQGERGVASNNSSNKNSNSNSTAEGEQNRNGQAAPTAENSNARRGEGAPKNDNTKPPREERPEETPVDSPTPEPSEEPADSDEPPPAPTPKNPKRRQRELPKPEVPSETPVQPPTGGAQPAR